MVAANVRLHTQLSDALPDVRAALPARERRATSSASSCAAFDGIERERLLDLGCGTGFIIDIAKHVRARRSTASTSRPAMLDRVDRSGPAEIDVARGRYRDLRGRARDASTSSPPTRSCITSTTSVPPCGPPPGRCGRAAVLRRPGAQRPFLGGDRGARARGGDYDPIVRREIQMVKHRDEDIEQRVRRQRGGLQPGRVGQEHAGRLQARGARRADPRGADSARSTSSTSGSSGGSADQRPGLTPDQRREHAAAVDDLLARALPLSRGLFKYLGFVATR